VEWADDSLIVCNGIGLDDDGGILADGGQLLHRVAQADGIVGSAVDEDLVLAAHMQHDVERHLRRRHLGANNRQLRVDALLLRAERREAHVENKQDENRVDHRDDLDAAALGGSALEFHRISSVVKVTSVILAAAQAFMKSLRSRYVISRLPRRMSDIFSYFGSLCFRPRRNPGIPATLYRRLSMLTSSALYILMMT